MAFAIKVKGLDRVMVCQDRRSGRFYVHVDIAPDSCDDMWEGVTHAARFASKARAIALAARVRKAGVLDLGNWRWGVSVCSPYAFMHEAPTAKVYNV